ncbi:hypothetical protein [Haladaptatus sp. ZSTT2]|uniref:hypothetical protein n=1 Tax=Haladaptatus sp. ZSTT2 TaxID=3120515 RepID=UPI00300EDCE5
MPAPSIEGTTMNKHVKIGGKDFVTVRKDTLVARVEELMDQFDVDQAIVMEGDDAIGTITYETIVNAPDHPDETAMTSHELVAEDVMVEIEEISDEMQRLIDQGLDAAP